MRRHFGIALIGWMLAGFGCESDPSDSSGAGGTHANGPDCPVGEICESAGAGGQSEGASAGQGEGASAGQGEGASAGQGEGASAGQSEGGEGGSAGAGPGSGNGGEQSDCHPSEQGSGGEGGAPSSAPLGCVKYPDAAWVPLACSGSNGNSNPQEILVQGGNVYWTFPNSPHPLWKVPATGGPTVDLTAGAPNLQGVWGLTGNGCALYFSGLEIELVPEPGPNVFTYGIYQLPLAGGVPNALYSLHSADALTLRGDRLYWADHDGQHLPDGGFSFTVSAGAVTGGAVTPIAASQATPTRLVANNTHLYWTNQNGTMMRAPVAGGVPVAILPDMTGVRDIAIDHGYLYWLGGSSNSLGRVPLAGGSPQTLVTDLKLPARLVVDGDRVYWTEWRNDVLGGFVNRLSLTEPNALPDVLAMYQQSPMGIAVDETSVYWTNYGATTAADAAVMRLTPK